MILSEFDKELYEKDLKEEAYDKGAYDKLCQLVVHQLEQEKAVEQIAEIFGEPIELIRKIADEWNQK